MTRKEAIKVLQRMKYPYKCNKRKMIISNVDRDNEALDMAIKALSQEPCNDAISRKKAICVISACDGKSAQIEALEQLPSVTQKSGKWIDYRDDGFVECPFCGHATNCEDNIDELHYCFYCGAELSGEEQTE